MTEDQESKIYSLLLGFCVVLIGTDGGKYAAKTLLIAIKDILK